MKHGTVGIHMQTDWQTWIATRMGKVVGFLTEPSLRVRRSQLLSKLAKARHPILCPDNSQSRHTVSLPEAGEARFSEETNTLPCLFLSPDPVGDLKKNRIPGVNIPDIGKIFTKMELSVGVGT